MSGAPTAQPARPAGLDLGLDDDDLVQCVGCGLCLPHCPTYRVTGLELASPRGRIAAMRLVVAEGAPVDDTFREAIDGCLQCRGCETACPSGVAFGRLMEGTRATLHTEHLEARGAFRRFGETIAYSVILPRRWALRAGSWLVLVAQRCHLVPTRFALPRLTARSLRTRLEAPVGPATGDVWVTPGCVMDAWQRDVHRATLAVVRAARARPMLPARGDDCCGALHVHAGRAEQARTLARRTMASMPGDAPVLVDSAGCGAAMKDYGHLLDTPAAHAFAARVLDVSEWLATRGALPVRATGRTVVVQDPCHLRHVQRAHGGVRTVLGQAYDLRETADEGMCCGAGGAYAVLQPGLAGAVRDRKVAALRAAAGATDPSAPVLVASANPGCLLHLRGAGIDARHPVELLAEALTADPTADPTGRSDDGRH